MKSNSSNDWRDWECTGMFFKSCFTCFLDVILCCSGSALVPLSHTSSVHLHTCWTWRPCCSCAWTSFGWMIQAARPCTCETSTEWSLKSFSLLAGVSSTWQLLSSSAHTCAWDGRRLCRPQLWKFPRSTTARPHTWATSSPSSLPWSMLALSSIATSSPCRVEVWVVSRPHPEVSSTTWFFFKKASLAAGSRRLACQIRIASKRIRFNSWAKPVAVAFCHWFDSSLLWLGLSWLLAKSRGV